MDSMINSEQSTSGSSIVIHVDHQQKDKMPPHLYRAAADGNFINAFNEAEKHNGLVHLVTPDENTVLHIYITAKSSNKFVEKILEKFSPLLRIIHLKARSTEHTDFMDRILQTYPELLLQANAMGETPLHLAARYGHVSIVEKLIKTIDRQELREEMLTKTTTKENDTVLHEAVRFHHVEVVNILTAKYGDFSCCCTKNSAGETPLYMAAEREYYDLVAIILENLSSDHQAYDGPNGRTALHAVVIRNNQEMTTKILGKCHELNKQRDETSSLPIHYAAKLGYLSILKILLPYDTDRVAYAKDKEGRTALHLAAKHDHHDIIKEIMSKYPDSSELVDNKGRNILHYAVEGNSSKAIDVITKNPSLRNLLNKKDFNGDTPFLLLANLLQCQIPIIYHPQLDKFVYNRRNQNAMDIVSANQKHPGYKGIMRRSLQIIGIKPGQRVINMVNDHVENDRNSGEDHNNIISNINRGKEAHLVVAALITTVTFAAGFTLPGGHESGEDLNKGTPVLVEKFAFQVFIIMNTIAMVLSASTVFIHLFLTMEGKTSRIIGYYQTAFYFTTLAMGAMIAAFITGMYAVLANSVLLATAIFIIGLSFFVLCFIVFQKSYLTSESY